ncbi:MAG: beta-galactosidase [Armatimonadota bacterium]
MPNVLPIAEVKPHHGAPTLFLDGEPVFLSTLWVVRPTAEHWGHAEESWPLPRPGNSDTAQRTAETGLFIYTFEVGRDEWCGPGEGHEGDYHFADLGPGMRRIIDGDPHARFYLQVNLEPGRWWAELHPDECEVTSEGQQPDPSYASKVWHREAKAFLRALISHLEEIGLAERTILYQVGAGETTEWTRFSSSGAEPCGDYSRPMREHFRRYLRERYQHDAALQAAWNDPSCSFDTATVPSAGQQLQTRQHAFRDPKQEQQVIDYFTCLAELNSGLVIEYCATVKEATRGNALAGAMYGYTMSCHFNETFYNQGKHAPTEYSANQRSGHLAVRRVLQSPAVDFLCSPLSYGFRGIGGDGPSAFLADSVRLHGKMCLIQDDSRVHDSPYPNHYGKARDLRESIAILRRNFNLVVTHGDGNWRSPLRAEALRAQSQQFNDIARFALDTDRSPCAEIAVLVDEESFQYESVRYNFDLFNVSQQCLQGMTRLGAPFALYHLDDFIDGLVPPHKVYFFLNAFRLDGARRDKLARELRRDGRVAVWTYAPGYLRDEGSFEHMTEVTGFTFGAYQLPWPPFMHVTDFTHPITERLPHDLTWGCTHAVAPVFYLDDPQARELGQVVFGQGCCLPGMGIKQFEEWTSVYLAVPNTPAPVLRGIARFAGVHLYSEDGDVLHVSRELLGVHTVAGGERTFRLPRRVERVYDLYDRREIARDADCFTVALSPVSTALYYTGDNAMLDHFSS